MLSRPLKITWFDEVVEAALKGYREKWSDLQPEVESTIAKVLQDFEQFLREPVPADQESGFFGLGFSYGPITVTHMGSEPPKQIQRYINFKKEYPNRTLVLFGSVTVAIIDPD